jgi:hypothetical protein
LPVNAAEQKAMVLPYKQRKDRIEFATILAISPPQF